MNRAGATATARLRSNGETIRFFGAFLESWMSRQHQHLDELLSAAECPQATDLDDLISRVLAHYQRYDDEKSRVADGNVFLLFGPPWLTRAERALLWVTGYKPGIAVQLATRSVEDLSEEQRRGIERMRTRTRVEEKAVDDEMARIQESFAASPVLEEVRRWPLRDGDVEVVESVKTALEGAVLAADLLRSRTAMAVLEILTPVQGVKFLAAAARLQLQLHSCDLQRDRSR